ncbi:unnamed protein product [Cylindrotheca closterium]|uniref:Uncharacterized protein n=1 Tax=Cylindrotheca closterium TaxID=2856 RepID=A0AAD2FFW6_9STRA|nr:unnamed protein product [Cylindrotheca closterium]
MDNLMADHAIVDQGTEAADHHHHHHHHHYHHHEEIPEILFLYDGDEDVPQDATHVKVDPSLRMIYAQSFFVHSHLRHVELPEGLRIIKSRAFFMCEALSNVCFPSTLEEIESGAFVGCAKLSQAILPKGMKVLGSAAFANCESLTHFQVPPLIEVIDVSLLSNCKNLYSVELAPNGIRKIGSRAFKNCHQLRNIVLPDSLEVIENFCFSGCTCLLEALSMEDCDSINANGVNNNDASRTLRFLEALQNRYDLYPLHKLCYYQGFDLSSIMTISAVSEDSSSNNKNNTSNHHQNHDDHDSSSWKSMLQQQQQQQQQSKDLHRPSQEGDQAQAFQTEDISGMTPLHVLALASQPNLELCQAMVRLLLNHTNHNSAFFVSQGKDRWNRDPLMYASMNLTFESTAMTQYLLEALLSPSLNALGLAAWRSQVRHDMDRLLQMSTTRSERVQHMEQIQVKLNWYLQMERLSLLELAIWKNKKKAILRNELVVFLPLDHDPGKQQEQQEQQRNRANARTLCGAEIVVSHVLLFLGDP